MDQNSNAIMTLCSHLCVGEGVIPLEPKEWGDFAKLLMQNQVKPEELFGFSVDDLMGKIGLDRQMAERIVRLIDRNASLSFELSEYENMGISAITRADQKYPAKLKKKLGNNCPPIFYYAGNLDLLNRSVFGYVGSRTVGEEDVRFTKETVVKTFTNGYGVVSGGAKGIDTVSEETILGLGGIAIEYLSDSMLRKMRKSETVREIQKGNLLLLSIVKPDAGFNVGIAMMRNRYIYAQSVGTVVVRSEYNKGGTWAGAMEDLKHGWCPELCWNKKTYPGNKALIQNGAIPIDDSWDGNIDTAVTVQSPSVQQITLFDI